MLHRYQNEILIPVRDSFDNIFLGMNSIFIIIMADGWNWVMYDNIASFEGNRQIYSIFFVLAFTFLHSVLLSLFTAILLSNFDEDEEEDKEEDKEENQDEDGKKKIEKPNICVRIFNKNTLMQILNQLKDAFGFRKTVKDLRDEDLEKQKKIQEI